MYLIGITEHLAYTKHFARCYEDKNEPNIGVPLMKLVSLKRAEAYTPNHKMRNKSVLRKKYE